MTLERTILIGLGLAVVGGFGGLIVWLVKGKIERVETDIRDLWDKKMSNDVCVKEHNGVNQRLDTLVKGQETLHTSFENLTQEVRELGKAMVARDALLEGRGIK